MEIIEVKNSSLAKEFLTLPLQLYSKEDRWVRPLDKDIEEVFDPALNDYFEHGDCMRWVLKDQKGTIIGRVAAFVDHRTAFKNKQPTGGMGFFECINDYNAAVRLFETCKIWLKKKGMEAMDGPINFGERDRWWGMLIKGREYEPNYCMPYTLPYYKDFFEAYGFKEYYQQYTYHRKLNGEVDATLRARAERITKNSAYSFTSIEHTNLDKVAEDFRSVYNQAWASYSDIEKMTIKQVQTQLKKIQPIMDKRLIWFGYYNHQPITFAVMLPEVNQLFKHMDGKFGLWEKLKFLWLKKKGVCNKISGIAFGVVPRFQKRGVESAIIDAISKMAYNPTNQFNYKEIEHNWVGDFNPQMMRVHELMGGKIRKVHATYRLLFDESAEFVRAEKVN